MLDEECVIPQGSDRGYINKMKAKFVAEPHQRFEPVIILHSGITYHPAENGSSSGFDKSVSIRAEV